MGDDERVNGVAARYAGALFELAVAADRVEAIGRDLDMLMAAHDQNPDMARLVASPVFTADEQGRALGALLPRLGVAGEAANLVKLLAKNRRLFALPDVVRGYRRLVGRRSGRLTAEVAAAEALSPAQQDALRAALSAQTGRAVDLALKVDPALIGGLVVKLGSRMIDTSLRTKLSQLRIALKEAR